MQTYIEKIMEEENKKKVRKRKIPVDSKKEMIAAPAFTEQSKNIKP